MKSREGEDTPEASDINGAVESSILDIDTALRRYSD